MEDRQPFLDVLIKKGISMQTDMHGAYWYGIEGVGRVCIYPPAENEGWHVGHPTNGWSYKFAKTTKELSDYIDEAIKIESENAIPPA